MEKVSGEGGKQIITWMLKRSQVSEDLKDWCLRKRVKKPESILHRTFSELAMMVSLLHLEADNTVGQF